MILEALVLKKFEFDKGSSLFQQLNELKTRALSKLVVVAMFFVYIIIYILRNTHQKAIGEGKRRTEFAEWHVAWLAE